MPSRQSSAADDSQQAPAESAPRQMAKDDLFHLLQNARRRAVLRYLLDHDDREQFAMRALAEEVAAWDHDTTVEQLRSVESQYAYISLYQSHLPKLAEHGVIDYNQSHGIVRPRPLLAVFKPYLSAGLDGDDGWLIPEQPSAIGTRPSPR